MPTSPEHQPEDQSLLDTGILSELGELIDPLECKDAMWVVSEWYVM
jgi:hypothetical protein